MVLVLNLDRPAILTPIEQLCSALLAVVAARTDASANGTHGILVTRHDFGHFSVSLSADVPYGLIHEHDLALRN